MPTYENTLIGALREAAERIGAPLDKIAADIQSRGNEQSEVYTKAISDSREEVILCYTVGTLKFVPFRTPRGKREQRYGLLDMGLYTLDGHLNGRYQVVWRPNPGVQTTDLSKRPPEYDGPWDEVTKSIPRPMLRGNSNASYSFEGKGGEGIGTLYATGPANLLLVSLTDESQIFHVSVCSYITGGRGDYQGAWGVNTALGSSYIPAGVDVLSVPYDKEIPAVTVSTFRVVRENNIGHEVEPDRSETL